ncbi:MAG: LPS export ABC transporter periplasmic protein LptC [Gammaproteobacteria bacterium]|nr:LPS export ABC transporter periplasmic protein LptC [Gammaproteobacteria bacterium]
MKGLGLSVFLAVVLIGALGSLFVESVLIKPSEVQRPSSNVPTDFFEDFTMRVMNEEGHSVYVLTGKHLFSYRGDEVDARIEAPQLAIDTVSQPDWDVTANTGSIIDRGDMLLLRGSVVLQQGGAPAEQPVRIETESLDMDTKRRIASTAVAVDITSPQWHVRSMGMQARLEEGLIDLLASVRARYTPPAVTP